MLRVVFRAVLLTAVLVQSQLFAWDYEAHRTINQVALSTLPTNFPAFVKTSDARERIGFLGGEPDRWRNTQDLPLRHANGPDHYMDVEELQVYGLDPKALPVYRYDFVAQLALIRKEQPEKFKSMLLARNDDHTLELVGLLPWGMVEMYGKLKSGFSYLKAYQEDGGTPEEIANAQANILYVMGVMGHLYGDASQPLHTTVHHHGWVGPNPHGYSTSRSLHSWIDGGYMEKTGGVDVQALASRVRTARLVLIDGRVAKPEEIFQACMAYVVEQNKQVEPLFQKEKDGHFSGEGELGKKGRDFLEAQMLSSAQFLGDIWYSAWQQAQPDTFLKKQLAKRRGVQ